uniref:Uncharacterized protein n=1 Tax=Brassica oleracea TaxID=3712 RepID=A0A3P6GE91_BRAOL|nr:unnamed protein product [Brassica oleracea]
MEMRLTSLESKGNENMNRGDYMDFEPWERMNCDREEEKAREEEKEVVEEKEAEKSVVEEEQADKDVVEDEEHAEGAVGEEEQTVKADEITDEQNQSWTMVFYKASEEKTVGVNEEKTDGINEEKRDMTKEEARLGIYLRCKQKMMIFDKPRKVTTKKKTKLSKTYTDGTPKKRDIQRKSNATMSACTPREKRKCEKSQWLQSSLTEGKTDDIDGQKKKRKTNA